MCFSAGASFGAGVVLSAIGVACSKKVTDRSQRMLAGIPFIFAIQQISEGFLWLALSNPKFAGLKEMATYNFLFFAEVVWPFWIPFAIYKLDTTANRLRSGLLFVGIGTLVSLYLAYCMVNYTIVANVLGHHIMYSQDFPLALRTPSHILYGIGTIASPFFSRVKRMWLLGLTLLVSYIIADVIFKYGIVSVWCFFASLISVVVYILLRELNPVDRIDSGNVKSVI